MSEQSIARTDAKSNGSTDLAPDMVSNSATYYSEIIEFSADAILSIDGKGTVELFNKAAENLFGYARDEVIGQNIKMLMPTPHREYHDGYLANFRRTGKAKIIGSWREVEGLHKDGTKVPIEIGVREFARDGKQMFTGIVRDLTVLKSALQEIERKNKQEIIGRQRAEASNRKLEIAEHSMRVAKEDAMIANKAKSEFLANMSHEIRTPMNGVLGMSEVLLETELSEDQRMYAETISSSGSALLTLINDILDFSKIETGKFSLDVEPFDLQYAIEDVVALLSHAASKKDVELVLRYAPELPHGFCGDGGRIRQVLTNLCGNATKFTLEGHVYVDVAGTVEGNLAHLKISVTDTGIGIPQDSLLNIFDEFEQVESRSDRKFQGTGLGLSISKKLVNLMGGEITAESELGKGSKFVVNLTLPLADVPKPETSIPLVELRGKHALIVDDLEVNRIILTERLHSWGITVESVENGQTALTTLWNATSQGDRFDFAILDFQMPGMDGLKLAELIHDDDAIFSLPLILLSSVDIAADQAELQKVGIQKSVLKPAKASVLSNAIVNALKAWAASDPGAPKPKPTSKTTEEGNVLGNGTQKLRTLIAEDNKTNQLVVKSMLKSTDVELIFASNGLDALEQYKKLLPDLILMDVSMPVMNGLDATRMIRTFEGEAGLRRCPIIALTANAMRGDRQMCLDSGMDDYLSKPVIKTDLYSKMSTWSQKEASDAAEDKDDMNQRDSAKAGGLPADRKRDAETVLDVPRINELVADFGVDAFQEVLESFELEVIEALEHLQQSLSKKNAEEIRSLLHLISGCAANIGAIVLSHSCEEFRRQICSGNMNIDISQLETGFAVALEHIEQIAAAA